MFSKIKSMLGAGRAKAAYLTLAVAVFAMSAFASVASAAEGEGEGTLGAIDVTKMTEPIETEVTANTPKLLLFIGTIVAIGFVIGWGLKMLFKGKRA